MQAQNNSAPALDYYPQSAIRPLRANVAFFLSSAGNCLLTDLGIIVAAVASLRDNDTTAATGYW